ncbi:crotonase/enoyl-CoA hydratase family protein [Aestuariibacter sp. AA17]|uniref:Crotonase/enoyl-CoA hydratase family protein n=1 Tax=Fluctibacter corallii TaxID=2984329 RepID=A0ABT3ACL3_9ALTE|nr:crotonase/enoyl-CoA hydratase family protein [Aestuariibacter sp. AA17]MCV2886378.1 crotonase/enoyl-CoA hydratase family protein [Aestuariibacter sp. AA17]
MSQLVDLNLSEKVAVITLQNGKVNAISHALLDELNAALDKVEEAGVVLVIKGQAGMFSAGYDLATMKESPEAAKKLVQRGSSLTLRLLAFPTPVIAACTGHAVAKGAFILLASDYRLGVDGDFKIGLNEVAIGMTMHHAGIELAKGRLAPVYFNRSVLCAEMYSPEHAVDAGFLDRIVPAEAMDVAIEQIVNFMSQLNMKAHHQTKLKARKPLLESLANAIELDA